ncbi:hypothetical protein [Flavobacterium sp.]|uniref:hypothetical protein n=1 Tax=Flavobacterium sp. TaxID=239 RepID=UPI0025EFFFAF|nr:hypothetical protein [Flavobacterium sp.]
MKLSSKEIKFIDTYLENSDVIFVDLRAEMTDHIATGVEEKMEHEKIDFYDAFKEYMIKNKRELLKSNNKMTGHYLNSIIQFSKTFYKPYNIILGLLIIIGYRYFNEDSILMTLHHALFLTIIGFSVLQLIIHFMILKKRYFYLEKTSIILLAIYYFDLVLNGFSKDFFGNYFTVGTTLFLYVAFIIHYFVTVKKFRIQHL